MPTRGEKSDQRPKMMSTVFPRVFRAIFMNCSLLWEVQQQLLLSTDTGALELPLTKTDRAS
jgi:hypothetical protein